MITATSSTSTSVLDGPSTEVSQDNLRDILAKFPEGSFGPWLD